MQRIHVSKLVTILAMIASCQAEQVTHTGETGPGSLRYEITAAAAGETITFAPALDGATIVLDHGQLTIDKDLTIDASALANPVTIDGNGAVTHQRVAQITEGATVTLDSLIITGGTTPDAVGIGEDATGGGGIHNAGTLTIRNAIIHGNTTGNGSDADPGEDIIGGGRGGEGGGIFNSGTLVLEHVTVSENTAGKGGAGIGTRTVVVDGGSYVGKWEYEAPPQSGSGGSGGGICNHGILVLRNSTVRDNTTGDGGDILPEDGEEDPGGVGGSPGTAGGIFNSGDLAIDTSAICANTTGTGRLTEGGYLQFPEFPGSGGGVHSYDGTVTIERSEISGNAGGVYAFFGTVTIESSKISGNAGGNTGGVDVFDCALMIRRSTISGNACGVRGGGGVRVTGGDTVIESTTISGNRTGDGIEFGGSGAGVLLYRGSLILRNCSIANNETGYGGFRGGSGAGVFQSDGTLQVINCTISGNRTGEGGTYSGGVGGLYTQTGSLTIENSIIAGNHADVGAPNFENGGAALTLKGNNIAAGDPLLAPLGFYGGPTQTMPPYPDSPAIAAGVATENTPSTDQRGHLRIGGGVLDLGAVENGDTGYVAWALATIPRGLDASFNGDPDGDGVSNGMVYATGPGGLPVLSRIPGGVELSFGYRPEAEEDLIWKVVRSSDLRSFTEILRIEGGARTTSPGAVLSGAPPTYTLRDETPPPGAAYYRLEVELAGP